MFAGGATGAAANTGGAGAGLASVGGTSSADGGMSAGGTLGGTTSTAGGQADNAALGGATAGGDTSSAGGVGAMAGENGTGGVVVGTGGSSVSVPCSPGAVVVKAIAAGQAHTCVLLTSGKVRCWGTNNQGQLGDGTTRSRDINRKPMVDVLTGVQEIATGSWHSCALMTTSGVR